MTDNELIFDQLSPTQILDNGAENVSADATWSIDTEPPFEPGIILYIHDDSDAVTVAELNQTAARALAYKILEQVERGSLRQAENLHTQRLVDAGVISETAAPFYEPKLTAVD